MEVISLILSVVSFLGLAVAGLLLRGYLPSYVAEKGKNAASKEDLAHLTEIVEGTKALHSAEMERLKAELTTAGQVQERRRRVYENMCAALRVFISGHPSTPESMKQFHDAYAGAWLWASDPVLSALNQFVRLQEQYAVDSTTVAPKQMKSAYTTIVLAMRKDVGFPGTVVEASDYRFVYFA